MPRAFTSFDLLLILKAQLPTAVDHLRVQSKDDVGMEQVVPELLAMLEREHEKNK